MNAIWKLLLMLSDKLKAVGALGLIGMSLLTCADVVGRFFKYPIFGTVELVSLMGVLAVATALPFTHASKGHIGVELFFRRLPPRARACLDLATSLLGAALFAVIAWRTAIYALNLRRSGEVSINLKLPEYWVVFMVAFCFLVLSAAILKGVIEAIGQLKDK